MSAVSPELRPKSSTTAMRSCEPVGVRKSFMKAMLRLRGVLEKLSNADLEALIAALATPKLVLKLSQTDFDFHATALLGALGISGLLRVARVVASAEVRSLLVEG